MFGQALVIGQGSSRVAWDGATAAGLAVASSVFDGGASSATAQGAGADGTPEPSCVQDVDQVPGLSLALTCSSSQAEVAATTARAASTSTAGRIVLNPIAPIPETPLSAVVEPVQGGLQTLDIPLPEPLGTSTSTIADGTRTTDEQGRGVATADPVTADPVSIDLLDGEALMGGIELNIARCASTAGAAAAALPAVPQAPEGPAAMLPTTGSDDGRTLAVGAALVLAGVAMALLRRRRTR